MCECYQKLRKTVLRSAKEHYTRATNIVKELSFLTGRIYDEFKYVEAIKQFDLILQAILLCVSIEDGQLSKDEESFITSLTQYEDILVALNTLYEKNPRWINITWKHMLAVNHSTLRGIVGLTVSVADQAAQKFTKYFSKIDAITEKNYFLLLQKEIHDIITALSMGIIGIEQTDSSISIKAQKRGFYICKCMLEDKWN